MEFVDDPALIALWESERAKPTGQLAQEKAEAGTIFRQFCAKQHAGASRQRANSRPFYRKPLPPPPAPQPKQAAPLGALLAVAIIVFGLLALAAAPSTAHYNGPPISVPVHRR